MALPPDVRSPAVRLMLLARTLEHRPGGKDHDQSNHGRRGLRSVATAIANALASDDPKALDGFGREQLRREARRRGIDLPRGASTDLIKDALHDSEGGNRGEGEPGTREPDAPPRRLDDRVLDVYQELAAEPGSLVNLSRLRRSLPDVARADLDRTLRDLDARRVVHLEPESNQKALTDEDRQAAIQIGPEQKHAIKVLPSAAANSPAPVPQAPELSGKAAGNADAQRLRTLSREEAGREFDRLPMGARNALFKDLKVKTSGVTNEGKKKRALDALFEGVPAPTPRAPRPTAAETRQREQEQLAAKVAAHAAQRRELLAEVERIANARGNNGQVWRQSAADRHKTNAELSRHVERMREEDRRRIQRAEQERRRAAELRADDAARSAGPASPGQVSYIMDLLARRRRDGEGGGFMLGPTTRDQVAKMTFADASAYIDSLTGNY